jgi:nucleotide-binding universal stress UspA family protein
MGAEIVRRVIVGVDAPASSDAALRWASFVASRTGAEVVAVSAWQPEQAELPPSEAAAEHAARQVRVGHVLDQAAGVTPHRTEVVDGEPLDVLLDVAGNAAGDVLVVGLAAGGSARRIDSFAGLLARCVETPLVAVPHDSPPELSRIVLGVDGSRRAARATEWCAAVAGAVGAEVFAVGVLTPELELLSELEPETDSWMRKSLQSDWISPLASAGVEIHTRVVRGMDVAHQLTNAVERDAGDAIVVGMHGENRGSTGASAATQRRSCTGAASPSYSCREGSCVLSRSDDCNRAGRGGGTTS